jgi:hypothetical protein
VGRFVFSSLTQMITDFVFVPHTSLHFCFYSCMCKRDRKCGLEREREKKERDEERGGERIERERGGGGGKREFVCDL